MNNIDHYKISSELSNTKLMASHFRNFCDINHIDKKLSDLLELALVEALNNIIIHAYENKSGYEITANYARTPSSITILIKDFGKEFTGFDAKIEKQKINKATTDKTNTEDIAEGSWGLGLIHSIADEVTQKRNNEQNSLTIIKHFKTS